MAKVKHRPAATAPETASLNRRILRLALPTFAALVAEPLFVLGDTAIVGHLGSGPLAGLSLGSTVIQTVVGLMIFLSYSTTPAVARAYGAADYSAAYTAGKNGIWAAFFLGCLLSLAGYYTVEPVLQVLGAQGHTLSYASQYLQPSLLGLPGMLIVLAAMGVLRGFQDTKTPLYLASAGAAANLGLSWLLVYPGQLGLAGSALATAIIQSLMGLTLTAIVFAGARKHGLSFWPDVAGLLRVFKMGSWLMLRTLSMRCALLATIFVVTQQGTVELAAYQLVMSFFVFLSFALDSLAIAAQTLLGKELGRQDLATTAGRKAIKLLKDQLVRWSLKCGSVTGLICPLVGYGAAWIFTSDTQVQQLFGLALLVVACGQPLAAYVFVLDGVLIGAQDMRYLCLAALLTCLGYLPMLLAVHQGFAGRGGSLGFLLLWISYAIGYMGLRALSLGWRARQGQWIR